LESHKNKSIDRQKRAAGNKVLAKAGLMEVNQHLYFYQLLCYIWADGFQCPAFANTQTVSGHCWTTHKSTDYSPDILDLRKINENKVCAVK